MACCGSGDTAIIIAGQGIVVDGTGQLGSPYVIALESGQVSLTVSDTDTIDMNIVGDGSPDAPFTISGVATVSMRMLTDVDGASVPTLGDVPVFNGTQFEFAPPPTTPPGAVNTGPGIDGDGSLPDPITIAVADLVTTATTGLASYIDSAGKLRVVPPTWAQVTDKSNVDAATISGRHIFVASTEPVMAEGDIWLQTL